MGGFKVEGVELDDICVLKDRSKQSLLVEKELETYLEKPMNQTVGDSLERTHQSKVDPKYAVLDKYECSQWCSLRGNLVTAKCGANPCCHDRICGSTNMGPRSWLRDKPAAKQSKRQTTSI